MARYLKSPICIIKNPRNVLLNSQKKVSRDIAACRALFIYSFILQEEDRKCTTHLRKNFMGDLFLLFKVIAREHVDTQGMLARKHMRK